jgi:uncharacterized protein DUF6791/ThiF family protein
MEWSLMSRQLIARNDDLARLKREGFDVQVLGSFVVVKRVPYVTASRAIKHGILISEANIAGEAVKPRDHVALFAGEYPCFSDGTEIDQIRNSSIDQLIGEGIRANFRFSAKPQPTGAYDDHHQKISTYITILTGPALKLDPTVTAQVFPPDVPAENESVFNYLETASGRAGITAVTEKLKLKKVGIIGLGGTGSYVLDLISKTPIEELHLFDGDRFFNHNAFRSPGAASFDELNSSVMKVAYYKSRYSLMRRGIVEHAYYIDNNNVHELQDMDFVFVCLDRGEPKRLIINKLEEHQVPCIDVGMGLHNVDDRLTGVLRTTLSDPLQRGHFRSRVSFADGDEDNEYSRNIQIADLNALNATFAVIKYKKYLGFYHDFGNEYNSNYTVSMNSICNEDHYEPQA